jgi:transcriptional regulator with XRE-family HTH domain
VTVSNPLAELIAANRKAMGLTLLQVGERGGLSYATVCLLELGQRTNPTIETIIGLSLGLGVPADVLFHAAVQSQIENREKPGCNQAIA